MFRTVIALACLLLRICYAQDCSAVDDYTVVYNGSTAFSVNRLTKTCTCSNFLATGGSGTGLVSGTSLSVTSATDMSGTATFAGTATFNGNLFLAAGRNLNIATSGSSISTMNIGSASSASPLNVFGTITASSGIFNSNLNVAGGGFSVSSGIPSTFNGPVTINGPTQFNGGVTSVGSKVQRDFFQWSTADVRNNVCVQLKTNIPVCSSATMYRFLIEGYAYHASAAIFSEIVGYAYLGTCSLHSTMVIDRGTGATTAQYKSSDNYVVLKVTLPATYYAGFSVSVWQVNPTWMGGPIQILSTVYPSCTPI